MVIYNDKIDGCTASPVHQDRPIINRAADDVTEALIPIYDRLKELEDFKQRQDSFNESLINKISDLERRCSKLEVQEDNETTPNRDKLDNAKHKMLDLLDGFERFVGNLKKELRNV